MGTSNRRIVLFGQGLWLMYALATVQRLSGVVLCAALAGYALLGKALQIYAPDARFGRIGEEESEEDDEALDSIGIEGYASVKHVIWYINDVRSKSGSKL
jgi:hypothetical protein